MAYYVATAAALLLIVARESVAEAEHLLFQSLPHPVLTH